MGSKATKSKKSATAQKAPKSTKSTAKATTSTHVPTPWAKLKQMWEAGADYETMAKATDAHYDPSKADPTKPTRAKIWKARNIGVTIDGKLVKFGARGKVKEVGKKAEATGKKVTGKSKAKKKPAGKPKAGKKAGKTAVPGPETKAEHSSSPEPEPTPSA